MADVFDLMAKIRLDSSEYESGLGKAKGSMGGFASAVGKGLATVAKVGAAAVGAAATGIAALTKMGVEGYAQYEQLAGGVETLFKASGDAVMQYAENAYKTSGMSANQYMETVTSFSASLIQSLKGDTAKAAEVADMAITDMADNANKMGTAIEMIQNAYNGFAKGNFTMLDNLKLGYGGTQEEMKRLLKDAEALSGVKYDIKSYADIAEAIHVIQTEMGITGTTAREAASTIEGSLAMMKAAWKNLVVGMADSNADMDTLMGNFVESTAKAAENLLPRITRTLEGIGDLITGLAPVIAEAVPMLVEQVLPSLLTAAVSLITALVNGIIDALPALGAALLDAVSILLVQVFGVSEAHASQFSQGVIGAVLVAKDWLISAFEAIRAGFNWLVEQANTDGTWLNEVWTGLQATGQALGDFFIALWDVISSAFTWCVERINTEGTWLNIIWDGIASHASMIWDNIKIYISGAIDYIQGVIKLFTAVLRGDWSAAWEACKDIAQTMWDIISSIVSSIIEWLSGFLGELVAKGDEMIASLQEGMANKFAELMTIVGEWVTDNIITPILNMGTELYNAGVDIINQLWDGLESVWNSIAAWWDGLTFSDKEVNVSRNTHGTPHATGLNYVPFDGYPSILHRGEAVLTAAEARVWRKNGLGGATPAMAGGITINQYIQAVPQTPVEFANATEAYLEQARWTL